MRHVGRSGIRQWAVLISLRCRAHVSPAGDQRAETGYVGQQALGAVDRVDDPNAVGVQSGVLVFLAQDAVGGKDVGDLLAHRGLNGAVSVGHGRIVGLGFDIQRLAEIGHGHRIGRIRQGVRELRQPVGLGLGHKGMHKNSSDSGDASMRASVMIFPVDKCHNNARLHILPQKKSRRMNHRTGQITRIGLFKGQGRPGAGPDKDVNQYGDDHEDLD